MRDIRNATKKGDAVSEKTDNVDQFGKNRIEAYENHARATAPGALGARLELSPAPARMPAYVQNHTKNAATRQQQSHPRAASSETKTPPPEHQQKNTKGEENANGKGRKGKNHQYPEPQYWGAESKRRGSYSSGYNPKGTGKERGKENDPKQMKLHAAETKTQRGKWPREHGETGEIRTVGWKYY